MFDNVSVGEIVDKFLGSFDLLTICHVDNFLWEKRCLIARNFVLR
jgi:hypothetical protein